jgi:hypothetical protein
MKNYILVSDVHSQYDNLRRAVDFVQENIENYFFIFLGDLFDSRNSISQSVEVYKLVRELESQNLAIVLQSNHQWKLYRYLKGNNVFISEDLQKSIQDFENSDVSSEEFFDWLSNLAFGVAFRDSSQREYRAAHAYFSSNLYVASNYSDIYRIDVVSSKNRDKLLYGILNRDRERIEWWNESSSNDWIRVAGHYHNVHIDIENTKSIVLDSGSGKDDGVLSIYDVNNQSIHSF